MRVFVPLAKTLLALPRSAKRFVALMIDAGFCVLSVWLAFYLRLDIFVPFTGQVIWTSLAAVVLALPIFIVFGLYRAIFRYSGLPAMVAVARAMLVYGVIFATIFMFVGVSGVPRTIGLTQPILLLLLIGASRVMARMWLGDLYQRRLQKISLPQALIYGAGSAGRQLAAAMVNSPEIRAVGFLDDDQKLHGHILNGLPIHNPADLDEVLNKQAVTDVLLALPSVSRERRNQILDELKPRKVAVRTLPGLSDITTGKISVSNVRELDIDDLLGREPLKPNESLLHLNIHNKTVLVTGAGGSIGSELCRQILKIQPKQLLLVEMSEFALYQIHKELVAFLAEVLTDVSYTQDAVMGEPTDERDQALEVAGIEIVPLLASVCDEIRMREIMSTWKPHTVYHAAAYKHVPLVEHNPTEGVRNNVWGTRVCAEIAMRNGVSNFVLVSTDKAVRPTNTMGASKRLAEMVLQALADMDQGSSFQDDVIKAKTIFSIVRFGNVLGSSGSVVPLFREQIKNGGPITLTHIDITRYFMTIPEAAQLVIHAGAMGQGGDVFVLDMGQTVKIIDLAYRMIELSGLVVRDELNPDGDIELVITGLRPGEKLHEELLIGDNPKPTDHPRIIKAQEEFLSFSELEQKLNALNVALSVNNVPVIRSALKDLVSGYQPSGQIVDWVHMVQERKAPSK
jgi:FlaA1/EpsC-like NDP-sugar epimerase